jgi:hypothetical protein
VCGRIQVHSCLCVVEELESNALCFYVNSLLPCLFLPRSLTCSDMVCASASVRTMSEDIKKALSYSHVAAFECHQVSPEVICNPFLLHLLRLLSFLYSPLFILPRPLSVPSLRPSSPPLGSLPSSFLAFSQFPPFILPRPLSVPSLISVPRSTHPSLSLTLPFPSFTPSVNPFLPL